MRLYSIPQKPLLVIILVMISMLSITCKKKSGNDNLTENENGQLQLIKDKSLSSNPNALQAIFTSSDNSLKGYYYGSFNANGAPDSLKQMIVQKEKGDTAINMFFDNLLRVKSLFLTVAGIKSNSLITFDYSVPGKTTVNYFAYNFTSNASKLVLQYTVDDNDKTLINKTEYASFGGGLVNLLAFITASTTTPDPFFSQIITSQGKLIAAVAALSVAAGWAVIGITGAPLLGVAAGLYTAYSILSPSKANASEVSAAPAAIPESPSSQTESTQLQESAYFVATKSSSGVVPFGGKPYCNYSAEYKNITLEIKINKQTKTLISASAYGTMNEQVLGECGLGQTGAAANRHHYELRDYQISGSSIVINFNQVGGGFPNNITTFTGTMFTEAISGTLTLSRANVDMPCLVSVPLTARVID